MATKVLLCFLFVLFISSAGAATATFYFDTLGSNNQTVFSEILRSGGVVFQVTTDRPLSCKYSVYPGVSFSNMEGNFDFNFETVHKKDLVGLSEGVYKYYVRCKDSGNFTSRELETTFAIDLPVSAKIEIGDDDLIGLGRAEIKLVTSKALSQEPSLSYSFDGISYDPVPLFGSGKEWTGYLTISESDVEETGSFKFQGRELDGSVGTEITEGGTFFVDTKKPEPISDIKSVGYEGEIKLSWNLEDDAGIKSYKIYKSTDPGVDYSNFLKSVEGTSFVDTTVEKGNTYYYRVAGVDEAGNIAELSKEVYATALLNNVSTQTGLELRYVGLVDNLLNDIDNLGSMSDDVKRNLDYKEGKEGELYTLLKMDRDINGAKSELDALRREVENYKSQSLSKAELDQRLNSAKLKLTAIKRKIPEDVVIVSEKTEKPVYKEDEIASTILRIRPDISEGLKGKEISASIDLMKDHEFSSSIEGYNLEIVFMDGTRREVSLIRESIKFDYDQNESVRILEVIPDGIANSVSDLSIKNLNYDVLKEDTILSFDSDTKEIVYTLDKSIDLSKLGGIQTFALVELNEDLKKDSSLSGYFSLISFSNDGNYAGLILAFFVMLGLGVYLFYMRRTVALSDKLVPLRQIITDAEKSVSEGRKDVAMDLYHAASLHYKSLEKKLQKEIYWDLNRLHKRISGGSS